MKFELTEKAIDQTYTIEIIAEDILNDLCETCGKWVVHNNNCCYGCKKAVEDCCC